MLKISKTVTPLLILALAVGAYLTIAARPFQDGTPPHAEPLQVSEALSLALTALVSYFVVNGLKSFSKTMQAKFKWFPDLTGLSTSTAVAIVSTIILFANTILAALPAEAVPAVSAAAMLLGAILSAYGIHFTVKGFQWPSLEPLEGAGIESMTLTATATAEPDTHPD